MTAPRFTSAEDLEAYRRKLQGAPTPGVAASPSSAAPSVSVEVVDPNLAKVAYYDLHLGLHLTPAELTLLRRVLRKRLGELPLEADLAPLPILPGDR
jgi:hypothetical protein